ncbi:hypothetical protein HDU77_000330 [Chytriomyces hyalinus]|nr:hypothetical protein HDU77_000330 [Chytriomyces hyalinus]
MSDEIEWLDAAASLVGQRIIVRTQGGSGDPAKLLQRGWLCGVDPATGTVFILEKSSEGKVDAATGKHAVMQILFAHAISSIEVDTLDTSPSLSSAQLSQIMSSLSAPVSLLDPENSDNTNK